MANRFKILGVAIFAVLLLGVAVTTPVLVDQEGELELINNNGRVWCKSYNLM